MKNQETKWSKGLKKSRTGFLKRIAAVFTPGSRVDDALLENLEEILIEADLGPGTTFDLIDKVRDGLKGADDFAIKARELIKDAVKEIVVDDWSEDGEHKPRIILVVGVNGTGKTTTIGKLAARYKKEGLKVILAGADTFRAAAGEQLDVWAKRAGVPVIRQQTGSDPAAVAFDAVDSAIARKADILLIDTAGRLHNKVNLMEELKKINRVVGKRIPGAPHEVLLVLDATTGQNGLSQARKFAETVNVSHIAITKLDGTARGGIVVSVFKELGIPVKWAGLGEAIDDLVPFNSDEFIKGMFGEK